MTTRREQLRGVPAGRSAALPGRSYIAGGFYFFDAFRDLQYFIRAGWVPPAQAEQLEGRRPASLDPLSYRGPAVFFAFWDERSSAIQAVNFLDRLSTELFVGARPDPWTFKALIARLQPFTLEEMRRKDRIKVGACYSTLTTGAGQDRVPAAPAGRGRGCPGAGPAPRRGPGAERAAAAGPGQLRAAAEGPEEQLGQLRHAAHAAHAALLRGRGRGGRPNRQHAAPQPALLRRTLPRRRLRQRGLGG